MLCIQERESGSGPCSAMPNQEVVMDPPFLYLAFFGSRGNPDFLHPLFMTPTAAIILIRF